MNVAEGIWHSPVTGIDRRAAVGRGGLIAFAAISTGTATACVTFDFMEVIETAILSTDIPRWIEIAVLYGLFYLMISCNVIYQIANFGHWRRQSRVPPVPRAALEAIYERAAVAELLILVPSYKEEEEVVWQTLMSAALVEYPRRRVVLLIDDPPNPETRADAHRLTRSRLLPETLQALFAEPAAHFAAEQAKYLGGLRHGRSDPAAEVRRLAQLYDAAANWLERLADRFTAAKAGELSHTDRLFLGKILLEPAAEHRRRAAELLRETGEAPRIAREYARLAALFRVEFSGFERKRYANLSHIPNKAMNLNSYLSLIGKHFREVMREDGRHLEACDGSEATIGVPACDYIATVDADSLITADYALRLVHVMEQEGNERVAVAQTPYTAIPEIPGTLERSAAASTDAQFFNHQGLALFDASFWVGASALMRRSALEDIARQVEERGHRVTVYIEDKILIEDAAATLDLLNKGWRVYHDPGRLSYSATPPDFGALIIQRRRWANGGLLILPRLLRYLCRRPWSLGKLGQALIRLPTVMSASIAGIGLPILLFYRFDDSLVPIWMPIAAVPYYLLFGCDLARAGYRWTELPRVYALNLLLIPVNFVGTVQSLRQVFTGQPIPFRRTPKIAGRTSAPLPYLAAVFALCFYTLGAGAWDAVDGIYRHMAFAVFNGLAALYGIIAFIGLKAAREDMALGLSPALRASRSRLHATLRRWGEVWRSAEDDQPPPIAFDPAAGRGLEPGAGLRPGAAGSDSDAGMR